MIGTRKNIKFQNNNKNKTVKSNIPSRNGAIKSSYNTNYVGTKLLPSTDIISFINNNFNKFKIEKDNKEKLKQHEVEFDDFFIVNNDIKKQEKQAKINTAINKNPNMSLDKFLAYSLYLKSFEWFQNGSINIESFKYQIGKDIVRTKITINNELFKANVDDDYYKIADTFNLKLMDVLSKSNVIDLNLINKIDIVMCQNLFNFITQTFTLMIMNKITPEMSAETQAKKSISIILNKNEQKVIFWQYQQVKNKLKQGKNYG